MAGSVKALQMGFDYQALIFWLHICRLFESRSKIDRVGYELDGVKSFDDVVVAYHTPVADGAGGYSIKDFHQVKFHVDQNGSITFEALIDPSFIGAKAYSFLQKLMRAQEANSGNEYGCRYYLITPWAIHPDNSLSKLISNDRGGINLDRLYEGLTGKSEMGSVRESWRNHLGVEDERLRDIIYPLRIHSNSWNLEQLENTVNLRLEVAGFKPFDTTITSRPYDDLVRKLHKSDRNNFSREEIQKIAEEEGLWTGTGRVSEEEDITKIGIRSFWKFAEYMEDEVDDLLSLNHYFQHRHILSKELWQEKVFREVKAFIEKYKEPAKRVHLLLDTHGGIAFAAGYFSESKGRTQLIPVQCGIGRTRELWAPTGGDAGQGWDEDTKEIREGGAEIAVAISVTHDVMDDVLEYASKSLPEVGEIISFRVNPSPGRTSVTGGDHAYHLAEILAQTLYKVKKAKQPTQFHLFIAAPNGFQFYLGSFANLFGDCTVYEYDFEAKKLGAYSAAMTFQK